MPGPMVVVVVVVVVVAAVVVVLVVVVYRRQRLCMSDHFLPESSVLSAYAVSTPRWLHENAVHTPCAPLPQQQFTITLLITFNFHLNIFTIKRNCTRYFFSQLIQHPCQHIHNNYTHEFSSSAVRFLAKRKRWCKTVASIQKI